MNPKTRNNLILIAVVLLCIGGCCGGLFWLAQPRVRLGLTHAEANYSFIPAKASNINVYRGRLGPADYFEFDLTQSDFIAWSTQQGWVMKPEQDHLAFRPREFSGGAQATTVTVTNALVYSWYDPKNRDAGFRVVYDLDEERVYYSQHRR
ncbi:MAG: hypothetical protein ACIAXF_08760 [Phycisphaerales bacterium JB063]